MWLEKTNISDEWNIKLGFFIQITIPIFSGLFEIHRIISEKFPKYTQNPT